MQRRLVILVNGYSNSGKDTLADYIVFKYPELFVKISIADSLKLYTAHKYKFDHRLTLSQLGKRTMINTKTVRQLLIDEAIYQKSKCGENIFINKTIEEINKISKYYNIIIPDFRFRNEYDELVKNSNWRIITVRINRTLKSPVESASEYSLEDFNFDHIIHNTNIDDFYMKINSLIDLIKKDDF